MDSCSVTAGMEMPGHAAPDSKGIQPGSVIRSGKNAAQAIVSDFKKKLESLSAAQQPVITPGVLMMPGNDLSMAITPADQETQGVAGILEGFELLDYQTDMSAASEADMPAGGAKTPGMAPQTQQAQMSGQFARMLNNEKPGEARQQTLQADAGAEKYSGSLESTNNQAPPAEADAQPPQEPLDEAAMLLKARLTPDSVPQAAPGPARQAPAKPAVQADNAQAHSDGTAQPAAAEKSRAAAEPQPSAADPAGAPQTQQPVMAAGRAVSAEPEAKALAADTGVETTKPQAASDFVRDNVIRIVDKASASIRDGRYEFDVDLKPDFLGKVSIRLTMEDGKFRMHVRTDDQAVKGMFTDQTGSLQSALKEKGLSLTMVDVSYQDPLGAGHETFGQQTGGNGAKREGQTAWNGERYSGSELIAAGAPGSELLGGSSVEYLA